ncbi:MAG: hypothetical protein HDT43_01500 [Ruminococcaceae bacterium]|nr:hypothetical protein [Oscillospiraceae bacterium]
MKKALIIILTLILGFSANFLAVVGLILLAILVTRITLLWYAAEIAVIAALTALLNFVRKKLSKYVNGAAVILCAQLPSVLYWAIYFSESVPQVILPSSGTMAASFIVWAFTAGKPKLKAWWSEFNQRNRLMIKFNEWWNEPL